MMSAALRAGPSEELDMEDHISRPDAERSHIEDYTGSPTAPKPDLASPGAEAKAVDGSGHHDGDRSRDGQLQGRLGYRGAPESGDAPASEHPEKSAARWTGSRME